MKLGQRGGWSEKDKNSRSDDHDGCHTNYCKINKTSGYFTTNGR